jgi:hypothetical protein
MRLLQKLRHFVVHSPTTFRVIAASRPYALYQQSKLRSWETAGRTVPGPPVFKQSVVRDYAKRFQTATLVETGTYLGQMVAAVRNSFSRVVTIELDKYLFERAKRVFERAENVEVIRGNSAEVLPRILPTLEQPTLFWLDAHYSGPGTARSDSDTPVVQELELVLACSHTRVILIDDIREFEHSPHYPQVQRVIDVIKARHPNWTVDVRDDILRAHPN